MFSNRESEYGNEAQIVHKTDPDDDAFECPELPFADNEIAVRSRIEFPSTKLNQDE